MVTRTGSEALFGIFDGLPLVSYEAWIPPPRRDRTRRVNQVRKHPPLAVGDICGAFHVIALVENDATCNERVRVACSQGHERICYAFNLRKSPKCTRCPR